MLAEEFLRQREKSQEENIIVPIENLIAVISDKTNWSVEELEKKDLGDIEKRLNIRPKKPNNTLSIKRGKSRSMLYKFVSKKKREMDSEIVTKLIEK